MAYQYPSSLTPTNYCPQQPMFPQPQGNVYVIQNSVEVANIPAGVGITAALCLQENLLYMKSMQNGVPMFLAYKLVPYTETPKTAASDDATTPTPSLEDRMVELEKQMTNLLSSLKETKKETKTTTAPKTWDD